MGTRTIPARQPILLGVVICRQLPTGSFPGGCFLLQLVAEGRTRKETASALGISVKTVEFHKTAVMRQLNLKTAADFTLYAIEHGMIVGARSG